MTGRRSTAGKLLLLSALYFAEGLPFGFQAKALPLYLKAHDVSLTAIGFLGALSMPWMAKALWAPLVDRYGSRRFGRRKSWIVPTQLLLVGSCAAAALVSPEDSLGLLLVLVFLMNLFAATMDIAVDGLAVDLLGEDELGPGNAVQVVGYKVGMLTSGGLLVYASTWIGWSGLFLVMAAAVGVALLACLLYREPSQIGATARAGATSKEEHDPSWRDVLSALWQALRVPGGVWLLIVVATYKLGESMNDAMFGMFLMDEGYTEGQVGLWLGTWGLIFSLVGSACGGVLALRVPLLRALMLVAVVRALPMLAQCGLALGHPGQAEILVTVCAEGFFGGALTTLMFAYMMSRVDRRIGATHFTLLASVEVLGKSPTRLLSGALADGLGYAAVFGIGAALSLGFLALLPPLRKARAGRWTSGAWPTPPEPGQQRGEHQPEG